MCPSTVFMVGLTTGSRNKNDQQFTYLLTIPFLIYIYIYLCFCYFLEPELLAEILAPLDLQSRKFIFAPINDNNDINKAGGGHWYFFLVYLMLCTPRIGSNLRITIMTGVSWFTRKRKKYFTISTATVSLTEQRHMHSQNDLHQYSDQRYRNRKVFKW